MAVHPPGALPTPPTPGHVASGAAGYMLMNMEATKGIPAIPTSYALPISANSIGASFDVLRKNIFYGARHTEQIIRILKGKISGNITHSLMANSSTIPLLAGLGKEIWLPVGPVDGIGGAAATDTATSLTTVPLSNTSAYTYTVGALALAGTPPYQELVQIVGIDGNGAAGTTLTFKQLRPQTSRAAGTLIQQVAQHKLTTRGPLDAFAWDLPTLTFERNRGRQYAWQMAGGIVSKFDIKAGKEDADVTDTMVFTTEPFRLNPGEYTVFNASPQERGELTRPMTIRDGYVITYNDQLGTGASYLSALYELEEWGVSWDNHTMDKDFWNGSRIKDAYPGTTSGAVTFKYASRSGRPSGYEDFLAREGAPPIPFFVTLAINKQTPTTPLWHGVGIYCPAMLITRTDAPDALNDVLTESVEATIVEDQFGSEPLQIFIANDQTGAYVAI